MELNPYGFSLENISKRKTHVREGEENEYFEYFKSGFMMRSVWFLLNCTGESVLRDCIKMKKKIIISLRYGRRIIFMSAGRKA